MCSLIVHLHLNRSPRFLILPHPKQPVLLQRSRLFLLLCVGAEYFCEAVVDIEGRDILDLRIHKAAIQLGRDGIRFLVHVSEIFADDIAVEIDVVIA